MVARYRFVTGCASSFVRVVVRLVPLEGSRTPIVLNVTEFFFANTAIVPVCNTVVLKCALGVTFANFPVADSAGNVVLTVVLALVRLDMVTVVVLLIAGFARFVVRTAVSNPRSATVSFNVLQCSARTLVPVTYCVESRLVVIVLMSVADVAVIYSVIASVCRAILVITRRVFEQCAQNVLFRQFLATFRAVTLVVNVVVRVCPSCYVVYLMIFLAANAGFVMIVIGLLPTATPYVRLLRCGVSTNSAFLIMLVAAIG